MEGTIFELVSNQGVWATLFIFLLLHQLRENRQTREDSHVREIKLTNFINDISKSFAALTRQYERLSDDVDYIKVSIAEKKGNE